MVGMMKLSVICLAFLANVIVAEVNDDAAEQNEQLLDTAEPNTLTTSKITKTLQDKLKLTVSDKEVPSVKEGALLLKQMCDKNGGEGTYDNAQKAVNDIQKCFNDTLMFSQLPSQIEAARPLGNLDQVFKEYCRRTDQFKTCVQKFLFEIDPCLAEEQKSSKYAMQNITESILAFACENEGDYIALFISEKGPQCISDKQPGIERCIKEGLNKTKNNDELYEKMMNNKNNYTELGSVGREPEKEFSFAFELEQCKLAFKIRNCIIDELKTCSGSTPANVVESIFNLVQRSTTCSKYTRAELDPTYSGAASLLTSISSIIIPAVTILLARSFNS